jgi:hypothetical protein
MQALALFTLTSAVQYQSKTWPNHMTLEQGALAALATVTSALVYVCRVLFNQLAVMQVRCSKQDDVINKLSYDIGIAKGMIIAYSKCAIKDCPFTKQTQKLKP